MCKVAMYAVISFLPEKGPQISTGKCVWSADKETYQT